MNGNFQGSFCPPKNVRTTTDIINAKFPNGQIIRSTIESELDLSMLLNIARQAHIFPNMKHSLVSIGELYDAGCTFTFKTKYVDGIYKDDIILQG